MKKLLTALCIWALVLACVFALPTYAQATSVEDFTYETVDGEVTITGYAGAGGDITIPATLGGYPVTTIGVQAFYDCASLTSVTIPDSVTAIGNAAFEYCSGLTDVTLPNNITAIGESAFASCNSLKSLNIPASVTTIRAWAFSYCHSLKELTIPKSVSTVEGYAFYSCTGIETLTVTDSTTFEDFAFGGECNIKNLVIAEGSETVTCEMVINKHELETVTIPAGVTTIGNNAFDYCYELKDIAIGNSVTAIGNSAFAWCSNLTDITLPNSVTTIGNNAFEYCSGLTSITIPDSVTTIGDSVFQCCTELTSITLSNNITAISNYAFYGCSNLTSITIPDSATTIGEWVFNSCPSLTSIIIPNSVTTIGECAIECCDRLTDVYYNGTWAQWYEIEIAEGNALLETVAIHCTDYPDAPDVADYLYTVENGEVTIIGYDGNGEDITVPTTIRGRRVTTIGDYAFQYITSLTNVTIPDSVTTIGNCAFYYCEQLVSVTIPDSVTTIGFSAFRNCYNLTSVTIPGKVAIIDDYAFGWCSKLSSVTFSEGITTIDIYAFCECPSLTSITLPDSVTTIGEGAFQGCAGLTSVTIPSNVTTIGNYAFNNCQSLTSVTIPISVTKIGESTFEGSENLTDVYYNSTWAQWYAIEIPQSNYLLEQATIHCTDYPDAPDAADYSRTVENGEVTITGYSGDGGDITIPATLRGRPVTGIGDGAFAWCSNLTSITLPDSITTIGGSAFQNCTGLTSVTLPDGVTTIGSYAFDSCNSLTSVTIPDSVTAIGEYVFSGCASLTDVYYNNTWAQWYAIDIAQNNYVLEQVTIHCTDYPDAPDAADYQCTVENGKVTITGYTGNGGDITIPATLRGRPVTSISSYAFYYCTSLTSVTIPDSVTTIGDSAFEGCTNLTSVTIPGGVTTIGKRAFYDCYGLTGITIPDSVTSIGESAFSFCNSLISVTIPGSITTIDQYAFHCCTSLTSITIPDSVTSIGEWAFASCSGLTSVTIPESVTTIGNSAFAWCSGLTSVTISDGVTTIGDFAFNSCNSLTSVTIPDSVTTIGEDAFQSCTSLTSVTIGDSVTVIGEQAFYDCQSLTSVTIPDSVTAIGEYAFADCPILTDVYYSGTWAQWYAIEIAQNNDLLEQVTIHCAGDPEPEDAADYQYTVENGKVTITGYTGNGGDITIPATLRGCPVTAIGGWAFSGCANLTSVTIPDGVTTIGKCAFQSCTSLTSVTIPDSVTTIGDSAFLYCTSLTGVTIPDSVTTINDSAFEDCQSLTSVTIPESVTTIGDSAFLYCTSLTGIWVDKDNLNYASDTYGVLFNKDKTQLIQAPGAISGSYIIPDSVITISHHAFYNCSSLTSITIPDSVTTIGFAAFGCCDNLTDIYYAGSQVQWNAISKEEWNAELGEVTLHFGKAHTHTYSNYVSDNNATCTKDGTETAKCDYCDETKTRTDVGTKLDHKYVKGSCTRCGDTPAGVKITKQPANAVAANGATAKVTVSATGDGLTYQWYFKNKGASKFTLSSVKTSSYTTAMDATKTGRQVYCKITDKYGNTVTTKTVTLSMKVAITKQPASVVVANGKTAKVTVSAAGEGLTYKWYFKNKGASKFTLSSIKTSSYTTTMDATKTGRQVYCKITDKYGNTVTTKTVTLSMKVAITKQPASVVVANGKTAKVTVSAAGEGLTYKWYFKNKGASKFTLSSMNTSSYTATMKSAVNGRQVYCKVTDKFGNTVTTKTVTLKRK